MTTEQMIAALVAHCKASVSITFNEHRTSYQTVEQFIDGYDYKDDVDPDIAAIMKARETTVWIQFYPETPIGFYAVYHFDLHQALRLCMTIIGIDPETVEGSENL